MMNISVLKIPAEYTTMPVGISVTIRKGMECLTDITISATASADNNGMRYSVSCETNHQIAVSFDILLNMCNNVCTIEFTNVAEAGGFYLLDVTLERLVTLPAKGARLAIPAGGGRLIDPERTGDCSFGYQLDSGSPVLFGCLCHADSYCALDTDSFENKFFCEVFEHNGTRFAGFSVQFIYRLAEFELIEYGHLVPAVSPEFYLKVQDACRFTLTFGHGEAVTWQNAAAAYRDKLPGALKPFYKDKIIGKICADNGSGQDRIRFTEIEALVKRYAALTNNQPAVFYLVGWQYTGHDTGYPAIDEVNKSLGTLEDLLSLIKTARDYNVTISFHDNYDDAYKNSPGWSEDMISLEAAGGLMKCGNFVQGQAYLLSNYKYAKYVPERVKKTVTKYDIRDSYHIDVLSGAYKGGRRYDFNPKSPAAAQKNLEGKLIIMDEFAKRGVDVTTEDFSSLFIGHTSHFWHINCNETLFESAEHIPLIPFIYHSLASWGLHGETEEDVCRALLYGACYSTDLTDKNFDDCIDMYYLVSMPWMKLYGKKIQHYGTEGDVRRVMYEDGSIVEVDTASNSYSAHVAGELAAKDFSTVAAQGNGVYLAYSRYDKDLCCSLPTLGNDIKVERLLPDGSNESVEFTITDNGLSFAAKGAVPYRITV